MTDTFPPKIECFVCGRLKGETNHWYLVMAHKSETFTASEYLGERPRLEIEEFDESGPAINPNVRRPVCGSACAHTLVERWMHTRSLEAPRKAAGDAS